MQQATVWRLAWRGVATVVMCGALVLFGCSNDDQQLVDVDEDINLNTPNVRLTPLVAGAAFTFNTGVPGFSTTVATTVTFTNNASGVTIATGAATSATAALTFNATSCIFTVAAGSTFPAGHTLASGAVVTRLCSVNIRAADVEVGAPAEDGEVRFGVDNSPTSTVVTLSTSARTRAVEVAEDGVLFVQDIDTGIDIDLNP